jgi:hypothetical protein
VSGQVDSVDLQELALRLSAVVDFLEERAEHATQQSSQGAQALGRAVDGFHARTRELSQDAVAAIASQAEGAVRQAVARAAEQCNARLQDAGQSAVRAAAALGGEVRSLQKVQRGLAWKAGFALLVGAALAAGGSALVAWKSLRDLERAGFGEDILEATRNGSITRCGEALCVRAGPDARRAGDHGEYLLVGP